MLPVTAVVIIPLLIEQDFNLQPGWTTLTGGIFMGLGLILLVLTIRMFVQIGRGTLAPWDPTRKLITGSLYAYVRNPMISGVLIILVGQAILFASLNIALWAALFFTGNYLYFILSEEPGLEKRFGDEYREYKKQVPRWWPRLKPWRPG